jgi:hypothetical protein
MLDLVTPERLERRGAAALAWTALRPIRLAGGQSRHTRRKDWREQRASGGMRSPVEKDRVDVEPEPEGSIVSDRNR